MVKWIRRNSFRKWLADHKPRAIIGRAEATNACPVANYLESSGFRHPFVCLAMLRVGEWNDRQIQEPDAWCREFIHKVDDSGYKNITAGRALKILDSIK